MAKATQASGSFKSKRSSKPKEIAVQTKGQKTRQEILDKSTEVLITKGYDALVLRDIALQVGIKLGNLQYYFPTREDLVTEVVEEYHLRLNQEMEELYNSRQTPKTKLLTMVNFYVERWSMKEAFLYFLVIQLSAHNKKIRQAKIQIYESFYERLESIIQAVAPRLTPIQRRQKARLITTLLDGIHLQNGFSPGEEEDPSTTFLSREIKKQVLEIVGL